MTPDLETLWHRAFTRDGRVKDAVAYHAYHLARYEQQHGKIRVTGLFGCCEKPKQRNDR